MEPSFDDVDDRHVTEGDVVRAGGSRAEHQSQSECGGEISHPTNFHGLRVALMPSISGRAEPLRKDDKLRDHAPLSAVVRRASARHLIALGAGWHVTRQFAIDHFAFRKGLCART